MLDALAALDGSREVDVIVFARGGGSVEDLLPFSDERLVRAVAAARTPIVSAIGHEGDNPLLDLVADVRASTPTDAAKRIVPDVAEEYAGIADALERGRRAVAARIEAARQDLESLRARPVLSQPEVMVQVRQNDLDALAQWLFHHTTTRLSSSQADIDSLLSQLRALSPQATLDRGYSILQDDAGRILADASATNVGESLRAVLALGSLKLNVSSVHQGVRHG